MKSNFTHSTSVIMLLLLLCALGAILHQPLNSNIFSQVKLW